MKKEITNTHYLPDLYVDEVKAFATNGTPIEEIAALLGLDAIETILLIERVNTPDDVYHRAYNEGYSAGRHAVDLALQEKAARGDLEAIKLQAERHNDLEELKLRFRMFGV
jgi:hypothetical protein